MSNRRLHLLRTPLFLGALLLLLLNDFYLKTAFHNTLTGKLSDFAGLFVFAVFWTALFPRLRTFIFVFTAAFFTFWKLPLSDGFIDSWNALLPLHLGRVPDLTDLSALLVLIPAWPFIMREADTKTIRFLHPVLPVLLSCFAFMATSEAPHEFRQKIDKHYELYASDPIDRGKIELRFDKKAKITSTILEAGWDNNHIIIKRGHYTDSLNTQPSVKEYYIIEKTTFGDDDVHMYYTEAEFSRARLVLGVPASLQFTWKGYSNMP